MLDHKTKKAKCLHEGTPHFFMQIDGCRTSLTYDIITANAVIFLSRVAKGEQLWGKSIKFTATTPTP